VSTLKAPVPRWDTGLAQVYLAAASGLDAAGTLVAVTGRRLGFTVASALAAAALLLPLGSVAATKSYSSGALDVPIGAGEVVEHSLDVREAGPVWHLAVGVRIEHARDSDLAISLVAPDGTALRLSSHEGRSGQNFGSGSRNCSGVMTVFRDDAYLSLARSSPPFDGVHRPDERLSHLYGKQARGRWTLRIEDDVAGKTGTLLCWQLDLSRNVLEIKRGSSGNVRAELSYRERDFTYRDVRLRVVRAGKALLDEALPRIGCGPCPYWRPVLDGRAVNVRDLDGDGDPEIVVDVFTGGAHCCTYSTIYRYSRARAAYVRTIARWGNAGYRLVDLDGDGTPEFSSGDDRFAYAFTAFVASFDPIRLWHFQGGRMTDVTRSFPKAVRRDAASLWAAYKRVLRSPFREVRGVLAAYMADKYTLGEQAAGWRQVQGALARGELGRGTTENGYPAGRAYVAKLRTFLRQTGYAR
jgi:subtilisin-like proprotein convertase family protein